MIAFHNGGATKFEVSVLNRTKMVEQLRAVYDREIFPSKL